MTPPRCILFDFWYTTAHTTLNRTGGMEALLRAAENPRVVSVEEALAAAEELQGAVSAVQEDAAWEFSRQQLNRHLADRLGLKIHLTPLELDRLFAEGTLDPQLEPGATEALRELSEMGINIGLVSNSVMSGEMLGEILEKLGVRQYFTFAISSADYGFRKPQFQLFKTALALAGEAPEYVWFMGDDLSQDIQGAKGAGLFTVWYNRHQREPGEVTPDLTITSWEELLEAVKQQI